MRRDRNCPDFINAWESMSLSLATVFERMPRVRFSVIQVPLHPTIAQFNHIYLFLVCNRSIEVCVGDETTVRAWTYYLLPCGLDRRWGHLPCEQVALVTPKTKSWEIHSLHFLYTYTSIGAIVFNTLLLLVLTRVVSHFQRRQIYRTWKPAHLTRHLPTH